MCKTNHFWTFAAGALRKTVLRRPSTLTWDDLTGIDRPYAVMAQMLALRHGYFIDVRQILPEAAWGSTCSFGPNGWGCKAMAVEQGLLSKDFNFADQLGSKDMEHHCRNDLSGLVGVNGSVMSVSVARTGTKTVSAMLSGAGQPYLHNHHCNVKLLLEAGAAHVIMGLRHPIARVVSGNPTNNSYISALRNASDPNHFRHMSETYRPYRLSSMLPMQFYLQGLSKKQLELVRFICTCSLAEDMGRISQELDLDLDTSLKTHHKYPSGRDSDNPESQAFWLSQENRDWISQTYAKDVALYRHSCSC